MASHAEEAPRAGRHVCIWALKFPAMQDTSNAHNALFKDETSGRVVEAIYFMRTECKKYAQSCTREHFHFFYAFTIAIFYTSSPRRRLSRSSDSLSPSSRSSASFVSSARLFLRSNAAAAPPFFSVPCEEDMLLLLSLSIRHLSTRAPRAPRQRSLSSKQKWREMKNKKKSESISSNNLLIEITLLPGSLAALAQERC